MPVDADLHCTDVVSLGCELKGLRTWKDICLVRNSLFQYQRCERVRGQRPGPGLIRGRSTTRAAVAALSAPVAAAAVSARSPTFVVGPSLAHDFVLCTRSPLMTFPPLS
ncbi:hypothetical protein O0L34_g17147 [Tuta absoluta]|nr:hypothetical protein O0L34_g17147 [Tuta absoluta]